MHYWKIIRMTVLMLSFVLPLAAQEGPGIRGTVTDNQGKPLPGVHVHLAGDAGGTATDDQGRFFLALPAGDTLTLMISSVGYEKVERRIFLHPEEVLKISVQMQPSVSRIGEVQIQASRRNDGTMQQVNIKDLGTLPSPTGNLESLLKTLPGVSSRNELSAQYSVRGGNFDENLVYINDVEIYRPFLIRAGKQEGLSVINPNLVERVSFSAGGFPTRYGDRMSSVLDITYKTPESFRGSVSASFLGASIYGEGRTANSKGTFLVGGRWKTNRYLLNSLDTKGEYKPNFGDIQGLFTYTLSREVSLEVMGNVAVNHYRFEPVDRTTAFGTVKDAVALHVYYEGQENDLFNTYMGAFTINWHPSPGKRMKWILSAYHTSEEEKYDIHGFYLLNALDKRIGSETYGDSIMNIGVGSFLQHARNLLEGRIWSLRYLGSLKRGSHLLRWGFTGKYESFDDRLRQWTMRDSAGYSIPYNGETVNLFHSVVGDNTLDAARVTAYFEDQHTWHLTDSALLRIDGGLRLSYWSYSGQLLVSPRILLIFNRHPASPWTWHLAGGIYDQPPLYKEARRPDGTINPEIRAQRSWHIVGGSNFHFRAWDRPFLWTSEVYYKGMRDLIPYFMNNVQLIYTGENQARGRAYGIDLKINGEFVKGVDSWASLSLMRTVEDVTGDSYTDEEGITIQPGYYPRPTDQLVNFGMSFQDYLPGNPSFRMHLSLYYATGLPVRPPNSQRFDQYFRMPAYHRVDIGFSKDFVQTRNGENIRLSKHFSALLLELDIFNLFGVNNTISYLWVNTVNNLSHESGWYAVPNYLTGRRINLKMTVGF
jgi:hypothetical protein